eukprot:11747075-Alexandrium_andersonii.AAC.1
MSASLVGSEMCIRDSNKLAPPDMELNDHGEPLFKVLVWRAEFLKGTVSYTHLTLPTICSV